MAGGLWDPALSTSTTLLLPGPVSQARSGCRTPSLLHTHIILHLPTNVKPRIRAFAQRARQVLACWFVFFARFRAFRGPNTSSITTASRTGQSPSRFTLHVSRFTLHFHHHGRPHRSITPSGHSLPPHGSTMAAAGHVALPPDWSNVSGPSATRQPSRS